MTTLSTKTRLVWSVDAMAKAKGITHAHIKTSLAITACNLLDNGESALKALEAARQQAADIIKFENANAAFDQLAAQAMRQKNYLIH